MAKRIIDPKHTPTKDLHQYLLGSVSPRPIAFVSTKDVNGNDNLAPYSFFNAFSSNPPILVFSSNRRVKNNTTKDTLQNIMDRKEAVINMVNYDIVKNMAITSVEYPSGTSEFVKAGLTPIPSLTIDVNRVEESPVNMECKVKEIIPLGDKGGAGHLIICEVTMMHINEDVLDGDRIDPDKIDLMGRMGRSYYVRASGAAIHTIYQSVEDLPIGYDGLPDVIKYSNVLSGSDIAELARITARPTQELLTDIASKYNTTKLTHDEVQTIAKNLLADGDSGLALAVSLSKV